jgi:tRNA uridine 5-carbamoylmethylation protein Kti12
MSLMRLIVFLGPPGTGKTHLSLALTVKALSAGYSALFTTLTHLAEALESASYPGLVRQRLRRNTLPKRRGRPLRSASKPCVRLIASHGSSSMWSVVIDTLCFVFGMPLVVTVSVKGNLVAEFFTTALTFRSDMIDLDVIFPLQEQSTPSAFSLLFLK